MFIILVETQLAENLGAVARVMANFKQSHLRLVSPKVSVDDPKAVAMAVGAYRILENAVIFDSLQDATADCCTVIGTTANPRDVIKHYKTPRTFAENKASLPGPIGLVFGPERTGLTTDQIAFCNSTLQIPVDPDFSSLNLSHAVGIILYELYQNQTNAQPFWQHGETAAATTQDVDVFLTYLEEKLDQTHFWRTDAKKPLMRRNLFGLFKRQTFFQQDLRTLRGMIEALVK
ncbi:MAG: RNA methyltransferase [Candidatus Paracaedibacteraceae bacterium]|nr:RNA methyltransferase [Candidatus Paracaedibacteraceae bacterium]